MDPIAWAKRFWWLIAAIVAVLLLLWAWETIKSPFVWLGDTWREWRCVEGSDCYVERLEADNERLRSAVRSAVAEARGKEALNAEVERSHTVILETRTVASQASAATHGVPDADTPLSPDLADLLADADRRMCGAEPAACIGQSADD